MRQRAIKLQLAYSTMDCKAIASRTDMEERGKWRSSGSTGCTE